MVPRNTDDSWQRLQKLLPPVALQTVRSNEARTQIKLRQALCDRPRRHLKCFTGKRSIRDSSKFINTRYVHPKNRPQRRHLLWVQKSANATNRISGRLVARASHHSRAEGGRPHKHSLRSQHDHARVDGAAARGAGGRITDTCGGRGPPGTLPPAPRAGARTPRPPPPAPRTSRRLRAPPCARTAAQRSRSSLRRFLHLHCCDIEIQFSIERPSTTWRRELRMSSGIVFRFRIWITRIGIFVGGTKIIRFDEGFLCWASIIILEIYWYATDSPITIIDRY